MTTIAYIGNFSRSWNTEEHVARDAEAIGVTVRRVEERHLARGDRDAAQALLDADLVLYTKTVGLPADFVNVWEMLRARGTRTASYHLDLYRGLARGTEVLDDPFWRTATVFTADGDPETTSELAMLGIDHRWLPAAVVSDEAIKVDRPDPIEQQIVFVGSHRGYHPEWPWRLEMLDALRRRYGMEFVALPHDGARIHGLHLNALYQQPGRIVVGDSLALPGHSRYWSDRYYETVGRGGFLIAPRVPGLEDHFQIGGHFVAYEPGILEDLFALIDVYRGAPEAARQIADAGQAHVAARHTYRHRVIQMLGEVGLAHTHVAEDGTVWASFST